MIHRILQSFLALALSAGVALAQATAPAGQAEVPVRQVVLFSSGVGYFEHFGNIQGNGSTELRFKTSQINDILKSLVLQDLDGGSISTITYPSQDPVEKTLRSFQIDITGNPSLAELLNQLRGAKITVTAVAEKTSGTILGVETKRKPVEKGEPVAVSVLNILTGATIKSVELDSVSSLVLEDQQLQEELTKALTALAQARDQDKKPVTLNFRGEGERRVRLGYVVETPVWKTSYRLILEGDSGKLQGWAIVENQTESDWNNVQLSLVSGRPISFVMDLYQPLYVPRPVVVPELYASLRPQTYDEGIARGGAAMQLGRRAEASRERAPAAPAQIGDRFAKTMMAQEGLETPMDAAASVQSVASAAQVGELFQYTVGNVSLPRQKSAMIPIITDSVEIERLSIYNASVLDKHPLNGARVQNTTDKHLLQGPITVLDANTYAGDARIDNLPPGQQRLLSYGIDLQMLMKRENTSQQAIVSGKIIKGVLEISRRHVATQDYIAENKSDRQKSLIIEHPIRPGWKLVDTNEPVETTQTLYRFKAPVPAKQSVTLTVKEQFVQGETIAILPAGIDQLLIYGRTGEIPQQVRDALARAIEMKRELHDLDRRIEEHNRLLAEFPQEQSRMRENMRTIDRNSQLYTRLLTKLNEQETQIEKLQSEREELTRQRDAKRAELEAYLGNLNIG